MAKTWFVKSKSFEDEMAEKFEDWAKKKGYKITNKNREKLLAEYTNSYR